MPAYLDEIKKYLKEDREMDENSIRYFCEDISQHADLVNEFNNWLKDRNYDYQPQAEIEGWTAKKLHEKFSDLMPDDIFAILVGLRNDPEYEKSFIDSDCLIIE